MHWLPHDKEQAGCNINGTWGTDYVQLCKFVFCRKGVFS
jgi:hypothetical protein